MNNLLEDSQQKTHICHLAKLRIESVVEGVAVEPSDSGDNRVARVDLAVHGVVKPRQNLLAKLLGSRRVVEQAVMLNISIRDTDRDEDIETAHVAAKSKVAAEAIFGHLGKNCLDCYFNDTCDYRSLPAESAHRLLA